MIRIHNSTDGLFYFTVTAKNGKTLVTSETYTRKENAINGAVSLTIIMSDMEREGLNIKDHTA